MIVTQAESAIAVAREEVNGARVGLAALVVVLFGWVFPAIAPHMPLNDGVVDAAATAG